jgi:signal transduction histidine kinase
LSQAKEITKLKLSLIALLIIISILLTYYNKYILDRENFNRIQNHTLLSHSIENVIDNFHYIVEKEVKLLEMLLNERNSDCEKIKHLEDTLEYGNFTFIKNQRSQIKASENKNSGDKNLNAINNFIANNISREHNLLSYHIKINSTDCSLSHVLYNIPIGKLIKNIESILANIKNPPAFFILDEYYNEIYRFRYTNNKQKEKFCTQIISPFSQEFYLCELKNNSTYKQLILALCIITIFIIFILIIKLTIINRIENFFSKDEILTSNNTSPKYENKESKQKLDFLSRVTHELRTPLNIIITFSEMIKDEHLGPINNKKYLNYSKEIYNYSNNLLLTVDNMIDSTKSKYYAFNIRKKPLNLSDVLTDILNTFSCLINEKKIQVQQNIQNNLPKIFVDQNQIKRALMNIISNAIKFNRENGKIIFSVTHYNNKVNLAIEDTGIGMSENSIINTLNDLYEIREYLSRKFDGMGIGLSLARNLIELNNGKLKIESKESKGTIIRISFYMNNM